MTSDQKTWLASLAIVAVSIVSIVLIVQTKTEPKTTEEKIANVCSFDHGGNPALKLECYRIIFGNKNDRVSEPSN